MTDQVNDNADVVQHAEPTPVELQARDGGWVPKDEYSGDEHKWVDAAEFVRRGPLFEKINVQGRELKEIKKALDQLKSHHAAVKETAYKEALASLKAQKKEAFNEGDPDKILEIDDKIDEIKEHQRNFEATKQAELQRAVQEEVHPEFQAWTDRNTWYNTSKPMRAFADALGIELRATGMSPAEVLKKVESQIKEEFPQKFQNPNRAKAGSVEGSSKGTGRAASSGKDQLTSFERAAMERFVRQGIMTEETYIAELKKTKEAN